MKDRLVLAALLLVATPARGLAYFEDVSVGSRAISMGTAAGANTQDVSAYFWNPAALAECSGSQALFDYGSPYGVPDLTINAVALGFRVFGTGTAVAWHRLGLRDVYSEDLFVAAAGRTIASPARGHTIQLGAAFKLGRVAVQPITDPSGGPTVDLGSQSKGSLDLGVRWISPWKLDLAWVSRDLLAPHYELVLGSGGGVVPRRQELALAYRWNTESTITAGWSQLDASGRTNFNLGLEIWFYQVFALRSGFTNVSTIPDTRNFQGESGFNFTGGFGVRHRGIELDAAVTTDPLLGASYRVSLLGIRGSGGSR